MRTRLILFFAMVAQAVVGQISFSESQSAVTKDFKSGSAVVSIDMNGDGQDDLVRLNNGVKLQVDLQYADESFNTTYQNTIATHPQWNLIAGDINNDGWPDIITSGIFGRIKVLRAVPFSYNYQISIVPDDPFFAQQMSDGTLKVFAYLLLLEDPAPPPFICIEEPENGLYHKLLETLATEFRAHATGRGNAPQLFITTHQPYFVDALSPDETWLLEKGRDGFSSIRRASDDETVRAMVDEGLPLGSLWYSDYLDARCANAL